jgi:hypothetical protein
LQNGDEKTKSAGKELMWLRTAAAHEKYWHWRNFS